MPEEVETVSTDVPEEERTEMVASEEVEETEMLEEPEVQQESAKTVPEISEPVVQTPPVEQSHSGLLMTKEGFAVRLPADSVNNIIKSLEKTPHEGFLPVVAFSESGQIVLNFESKASDA
jgi:hypothetical protein